MGPLVPSILQRKAVPHGAARPRIPAVFFEPMSKRKKGFPSETHVKQGVRCVCICPGTVGSPWVDRLLAHLSQRYGPVALDLKLRQPEPHWKAASLPRFREEPSGGATQGRGPGEAIEALGERGVLHGR